MAETAKLVGVSRKTTRRVEAEAAVSSFDTEAEREQRKTGRPSKAEPFRSFLVGELIGQPDVLAVELLRRAKNKDYTGAKSALFPAAWLHRGARIKRRSCYDEATTARIG